MYHLSLNISGQLCIIVGGGKVAERKALSLLKAGAQVRLISPQLTDALHELAAARQIDWLPRCFELGDLADALLVFAATDSAAANKAAAQEAKAAGKLINVADAPELCSFHVPAVVRQGDLSIAVSTNGKSPALAARIRKELEAEYGPEYAVLLDLLGRVRAEVLAGTADGAARRNLFENLPHEDILLWIKTGQKERLRSWLRAVLGPDADYDLSQPDNS
ncbi:precorrin-2 dehydrogenase/sirohydrochlorin ferrochelatase family protein [Candidatus Electronema sp. JC]|uniref:precorrin-2 dehydrogenase/sirohydrochlorin ferrochelatase family protein n=1 Tax=Candidatus Electronema sp. JC TaxID=3401570 RepID=UPI003B436FFD